MALRELAPRGVGCHHAGMLRPDRSLVERLFKDGTLRVLVCTATLAWGVNLPAHAVVIKGTRIYDPDRSDYVDLDILDVLQVRLSLLFLYFPRIYQHYFLLCNYIPDIRSRRPTAIRQVRFGHDNHHAE